MNEYSTIYADPPWNQKAGRNLSGGYRKENGVQVFNPVSVSSCDLPYKSMSVNDIANLNIRQLAAKDAHLYLWVTNKYLLQSAKVIEAWGFKYSTCLTWSKNQIGGGMGGSFRVSHEHLLFCTRGNLKGKETIRNTVFNVKRSYVNGYPCHSKKPPFFRQLIEKVSPGPYLELFARERAAGWDSWGNEVESDVTIATHTSPVSRR